MVKKALLDTLDDVDVRLLKIFKAVVKCGGFAAAEIELNIGRSTISRHIKELETRLGLSLCIRGRAGFSLTHEGKQIYSAAQRLLESLDNFQSEVGEIHQSMNGKFKLAFLDQTANNLTSNVWQAIRKFSEFAPKVDVEIHIEPINVIEHGVLDGRYELGMVPIHRESNNFNFIPLFKQNLSLFCSRDNPLFDRDDADITEDDIRAQKYAGIAHHSGNLLATQRHNLTRNATAFDQEGLAHFILSGAYVAFLPNQYAEHYMNHGRMRPIGKEFGYFYQTELNAITRKVGKPSRMLSFFMKCLEEANLEASK